MVVKGMRASSKAVLAFGMVAAPVKLYKATEEVSISFNQLHSKCNHRLKQMPMYCPKCSDGELPENFDPTVEYTPFKLNLVERNEIVKGYEVADGQFVTLTEQEIDSASLGKDTKLQIKEFVPYNSVDPVWFDGSNYWVGPDKGGEASLALIATALGKTGKVAIAQMAVRGKLKTIAIRPYWNGNNWVLCAHYLNYDNEVRSPEAVPGTNINVDDSMLDLAVGLIEKASKAAFDPSVYVDTVREKLLEIIDTKKKGGEITINKEEEASATIDLREALLAMQNG